MKCRWGSYVDPLEYVSYFGTDWCGARTCGNCSQTCAGVMPAPISPSQRGGMESEPLWLSRIRAGELDPPALWKWANGPFDSRAPRPVGATAESRIALADLARAGLPELDATLGEPRDIIGNSNALETLGADYSDRDTKQNRAAINIFRTDKNAYSHDYAVCQRFKGGDFDFVAPIEFSDEENKEPPTYYWATRRSNTHDETEEEAISFAVYVSADERTFTVDSRWLSDDYPPATEGYMLSFQIWGVDMGTVATIVDNLLDFFRQRGTLVYKNTSEPRAPEVTISKASYGYAKGTLTMVNEGTVPALVKFHAATWSAPHPGSDRNYDFEHVIPPGTSVVALPMPGMLNGVVYATDGIFTDKVYIADGHWFVFDDSGSGGTSSAKLVSENCRARTDEKGHELLVAGCGEMSGTVTARGWIGMARGLNPTSRRMIDASLFNALTFFTRGDGKTYRLGVETENIARLDTADWHQIAFASPAEGRQITVPFAALVQQGWDAQKVKPLTTHDVRSLVWLTVGEPHDQVRLFVDDVSFTRAAVISDTRASDRTVSARIASDTPPTAVIAYSIDGGQTFQRIAMRADADRYIAEIPGQPSGTEVRYYVEAEGPSGTITTDPVNAPFTTHRFRIGGLPRLVIDDFADTNPVNVLGGNSSLFGTDTGSTITVRFEDAARFDYDVTAARSYAGYYTLLGGIDARPYDTLRFRIRGGSGREIVKVGLRTRAGREQKLLVPVAITTEWQDVVIPLTLFREIDDLSALENVVIAFEQQIGSGRGTVYLDDLEFGSTRRRAR